jgi:hypothetical protein
VPNLNADLVGGKDSSPLGVRARSFRRAGIGCSLDTASEARLALLGGQITGSFGDLNLTGVVVAGDYGIAIHCRTSNGLYVRTGELGLTLNLISIDARSQAAFVRVDPF